MAKKRITKEERQARREQKRQEKAQQKQQLAADKEKIRAADADLKAKERERKAGTSSATTPATTPEPVVSSYILGAGMGIGTNSTSAPSEPRVMHVSADPETGEQTNTQYKSVADYTQNNPEEVTTTLNGKDPKNETIRAVVSNEPYNKERVEQVSDAVDQSVKETEKEVEKGAAIQKAAQAQVIDNTTDLKQSRVIEEGYRPKGVGDYAAEGDGDYELPDSEYSRMSQDFLTGLAAQKANAPAAAIEAMGIEQYFPPQQDFITSNFTGRYIGSRQLVAGTGALIPVGLLDARNKAREAKARAKAENEGKFWELASTTPQYDEKYKNAGMDILQKYYNLSGGNLEELIYGKSELSMQFRRDMKTFESRGQNLLEINTNVKSIMDKLHTGEGEDMYVAPAMYDDMKKFLDGTADMDAYIKGESLSDSEIQRINNSIRAYQNFTPIADKHITALKGEFNKGPLRKDVDWNDPVVAANYEEAMSKAGSTRDWTAYTQIISKYYDKDRLRAMVEGIHENNRLYEGASSEERERIIQDHTRYITSRLGTQIDIQQEFKSTNALGWASLAHKKSVWQTKKQWRTKDIESMYHGINREMSDPQFQADVVTAFNSSTDPIERRDALAKVYHKYKRTPDITGGYASMRLPTLGSTVQSVTPNTLQVIGKDGKQRSIGGEIIERQKALQGLQPDSDAYKAIEADINELQYIQSKGSTPMDMNVGSRTVTMSYYDESTNKIVPLDTWNGTLDPAMLTNTAHLSGTVSIVTGRVGEDDKKEIRKSSYHYVNNHNIENEATRRALSSQEGRAESIGYGKEYFYDDGEGGSYTGSGESVHGQQGGDNMTQNPYNK